MTNHFFGEAQGDEKEEDKRGCLGLASRETRVEHLNTCTKPHLLFVYNIKVLETFIYVLVCSKPNTNGNGASKQTHWLVC